ncbi:DUF3320 domain-containing protein, partial [Methanobrevibacter sp.]|uniref:DUF3320 domain-containing protein n=1 Tax=Methanobrevibacter sp. TaxID=66852 RepID=UPI0026E0539E
IAHEEFENELKSDVKDESDREYDDKVDLGSDDDYIYVDHSNDEPIKESGDEDEGSELSHNSIDKPHKSGKSKMKDKFDSFISDVIHADSQLEPEEIETVRGEVIEEGEEPLHKPAPKDEFVVEAEIVKGEEELNIFNDELPDLSNDISYDENDFGEFDLERPTPKGEFENDELNVLNDESLDFGKEIHDEATRIVDKAMEEFMDGIFDSDELDNDSETEIIKENNADVQRPNIDAITQEIDDEPDEVIITPESSSETPGDGVTYYQGSNDVRSKLRKNNFYYDDEKPRSVRDSIRGIKKDMKYINKSLKEIENPTHVDYVSVVDRTEDYNIEDYLSRPSDDDSHLIIEKEEEMTFAEMEEKRIEKELMMEALEKELASDDNVIVTAHEHHRREEIKDQTLEDIIQSANDDYREIEKERYQNNNTLKSFDDKKLPGKSKLEDNIIEYVEADDIGLSSSDDLYKKPAGEVAKSINNIVDIEGPIHVNEVVKRVKDSCHIKRAGSNLKKAVNAAIDEAENSGDIIRIGDFLYDATNNNVVIRKRNKPNIELISDEEISKNIELVLLYKQNLTTKQIAKEASRNFGFKSTSKKTSDRINSVLDLMIANNKVKINNDFVELN